MASVLSDLRLLESFIPSEGGLPVFDAGTQETSYGIWFLGDVPTFSTRTAPGRTDVLGFGPSPPESCGEVSLTIAMVLLGARRDFLVGRRRLRYAADLRCSLGGGRNNSARHAAPDRSPKGPKGQGRTPRVYEVADPSPSGWRMNRATRRSFSTSRKMRSTDKWQRESDRLRGRMSSDGWDANFGSTPPWYSAT